MPVFGYLFLNYTTNILSIILKYLLHLIYTKNNLSLRHIIEIHILCN